MVVFLLVLVLGLALFSFVWEALFRLAIVTFVVIFACWIGFTHTGRWWFWIGLLLLLALMVFRRSPHAARYVGLFVLVVPMLFIRANTASPVRIVIPHDYQASVLNTETCDMVLGKDAVLLDKQLHVIGADAEANAVYIATMKDYVLHRPKCLPPKPVVHLGFRFVNGPGFKNGYSARFTPTYSGFKIQHVWLLVDDNHCRADALPVAKVVLYKYCDDDPIRRHPSLEAVDPFDQYTKTIIDINVGP